MKNHTSFLCNGAAPPTGKSKLDYTSLNHQALNGEPPNVRIGLSPFVSSVYHLPARCLDLLEIAAYVFAADRLTTRGPKRAVEYQSWPRALHFIIKIRDHDFWSSPKVCEALEKLLCFATGDHSYKFSFQPGHTTPPTNLFDSEVFSEPHEDSSSVVLFSGGIDSLAGAIQRLERTDGKVCLVSHLSQNNVIGTQRALASALRKRYDNRVSHYQFKTNLKAIKSREETQRSRPFLYGSIAFALARALGLNHFYIYENGVTSLNFARREDLINARASRTTHPQVIKRLANLLTIIAGEPFSVNTPFLWHTKSDAVRRIKDSGHGGLLSSSVSCNHTFNPKPKASHCGACFQCLDRRIGVYAADAHELDNKDLYAVDIIASKIPSGESKTTVVDYLRQAADFSTWGPEHFHDKMLDELQALLGWIPDCDEDNLVDKVWDLCSRHGAQVSLALRRMRDAREEVLRPLNSGSLLKIISDREFLKTPIRRLVASIEKQLRLSIPKLFRSAPPADERDLNDKIDGLLATLRLDLEREHPSVPFAGAGVTPDFDINRGHLLIEGKYIREATTPSKITEGMAADLTKCPQEAHILFVVYDPNSAIPDRNKLRVDFEQRGCCTVCVLP